MGIVRRQGQWRLEKVEDGHYQITFQNAPEAQILTPEFDPGMRPSSNPTLPTHEVDSYREAEGIFEELSQETSSTDPGLGYQPQASQKSDPVASELGYAEAREEGAVDVEDLTMGSIAIGLVIIGGAFLYTFSINTDVNYSLFGIGAVGGGALILGYAAFIAWNESVSSAVGFLRTAPLHADGKTSEGDTTEKTPQLSQRRKTKLIHERANRKCEFCGKESDHLEVHHIVPRSEGGPNSADNLIALCLEDHKRQTMAFTTAIN